MATRSQAGNVILAVMFGLFLLGTAGGVYFFVFAPSGQDEKNRSATAARSAYDEAVADLERALGNPQSIDTSLDHNASFSCLFAADGACRGRGGAFLLFEAGNQRKPLSHLASDTGADIYGAPCRGYPSRECPLRVETVWEPVCAGDRCEGTKSLRVKAKVTLSPVAGDEAPIVWNKDFMFSPNIRLSQGAQCARGGGEWTGAECLSPSQVAERRLASPKGSRPEGALPSPSEMPLAAPLPETPAQPVVYECPNQIVVQGQYYPVQFLAADRGQVTVPAMSCQAQGAVDVFVFQCAQKTPAAFPNEGQWIQVEAVMAPACDQFGNPVGNLPTRI